MTTKHPAVEALKDLVGALDRCTPTLDGLFAMRFVRTGKQYDGPTYGEELKAAREYLATFSSYWMIEWTDAGTTHWLVGEGAEPPQWTTVAYEANHYPDQATAEQFAQIVARQRSINCIATEHTALAALPTEEAEPEKCTGMGARWCPIHGQCTCHVLRHSELDCPLHGTASTHAAPPQEDERKLPAVMVYPAGDPTDLHIGKATTASAAPTQEGAPEREGQYDEDGKCRSCGEPSGEHIDTDTGLGDLCPRDYLAKPERCEDCGQSGRGGFTKDTPYDVAAYIKHDLAPPKFCDTCGRTVPKLAEPEAVEGERGVVESLVRRIMASGVYAHPDEADREVAADYINEILTLSAPSPEGLEKVRMECPECHCTSATPDGYCALCAEGGQGAWIKMMPARLTQPPTEGNT